ncbi:MAG TPA: C40 family peptidase [Rhodocyclaceae bacterium]|nr:C40 family peptidase [Rhodocyclaceae bacterium]
MRYAIVLRLPLFIFLIMLAACSSSPNRPSPSHAASKPTASEKTPAFHLGSTDDANEIVLFSFGLLDTGYKFGGSNPEAGLDCSGMVSYVVERVTGHKLPHNAAQIAAVTRPIERTQLQPADLVFFNTNGQTFSHMGIYLGDGRFMHAPSTNGKVRIEKMDNKYFASRYSGARTLF